MVSSEETLRREIAGMRKRIAVGETVAKTSLLDLLQKVEANAEEMWDLFDQCRSLLPRSVKPDDVSAVQAQKVFDTPELLELILSFLAPRDLLSAQQVGIVWAAAVLGSRKLQSILYLRPEADDVPFSTAFTSKSFPGFKVDAWPSQPACWR